MCYYAEFSLKNSQPALNQPVVNVSMGALNDVITEAHDLFISGFANTTFDCTCIYTCK